LSGFSEVIATEPLLLRKNREDMVPRYFEWVKRGGVLLIIEPLITNGTGRHLNLELRNSGSVNRCESKRMSLLGGLRDGSHEEESPSPTIHGWVFRLGGCAIPAHGNPVLLSLSSRSSAFRFEITLLLHFFFLSS